MRARLPACDPRGRGNPWPEIVTRAACVKEATLAIYLFTRGSSRPGPRCNPSVVCASLWWVMSYKPVWCFESGVVCASAVVPT